jgi:signal transduction histidine kinase
VRQHRIYSAPADGGYACTALENSSAVAAFAVSVSGELRAANGKMAALLGAKSGKELVGVSLADLISDGQGWEARRRACLEGEGRGVLLILKSSGGQRVILKGDLESAEHPAEGEYISGVFIDVSEEHKLRQAVQRSARMEALGSLTSGIAHDFNNLLTVLVGNLYLVAEELRDNPEAFEKLKSARDAARRGTDLIRQLLAFARREVLDTDVVDPVKVIEGLVPLLRRALGSRVVLETKLQRECGSMQCNAGQLESVIVNLSVNARDAINAKDAKCGTGHALISVEPIELAAHEAERRSIEPGG